MEVAKDSWRCMCVLDGSRRPQSGGRCCFVTRSAACGFWASGNRLAYIAFSKLLGTPHSRKCPKISFEVGQAGDYNPLEIAFRYRPSQINDALYTWRRSTRWGGPYDEVTITELTAYGPSPLFGRCHRFGTMPAFQDQIKMPGPPEPGSEVSQYIKRGGKAQHGVLRYALTSARRILHARRNEETL